MRERRGGRQRGQSAVGAGDRGVVVDVVVHVVGSISRHTTTAAATITTTMMSIEIAEVAVAVASAPRAPHRIVILLFLLLLFFFFGGDPVRLGPTRPVVIPMMLLRLILL